MRGKGREDETENQTRKLQNNRRAKSMSKNTDLITLAMHGQKESDDLKRRIEEWVQETASQQCINCIDTCCDGTKHFINISGDDLEPFLEIGVPVFNWNYFDAYVLLKWRSTNRSNHMKLFTKEGIEIPKPALIEATEFMHESYKGIVFEGKSEFSLYVDKYCPFYNFGKGCEIHDDPRRPKVCKEYPVIDMHEGTYDILPSCKPFNQREVREDFRKNFPEPSIVLANNGDSGRCIIDSSRRMNELEYGEKVK